MASGTKRSQAERSCLNTADGCNRILSLSDALQGESVITSSQPTHRSERAKPSRRKGEDKAALDLRCVPFLCRRLVTALSWPRQRQACYMDIIVRGNADFTHEI